MRLSESDNNAIREYFPRVKTVRQLAELLNIIYEIRFPKRNAEQQVTIEARHLTYYAFQPEVRAYQYFDIRKKSGSTRRICAPRYKLKTIQKCLNSLLQALYSPSEAAFGFVAKRNIVDNASRHVGKRFVYNLDLANFFPSINFGRVRAVLRLPPYLLTDDEGDKRADNSVQKLDGRGYLGFIIANICCHEGSLPQGAPTSPTLSNIVSQRLDKKLLRFARRHKITYTRYADDITFSANRNVFSADFRQELYDIIRTEQFEPNLQKERLQNREQRQSVTGIIVNNRLNLPCKYLKNIRYWLHYAEKYGEKATVKRFELLRAQKGEPMPKSKLMPVFFKRYLQGKIRYFAMVRGANDALSLRLQTRFDNIYSDANGQAQSDSPISDDSHLAIENIANILAFWSKEGLDNAANKYEL